MKRAKNNISSKLAMARGFTLFEMAVALAIIGILAGTLLSRVLYYQEQAELTAVEQVAGAVRSALTLRAAKLYMHNDEANLRKIVSQNPMNLLAQKPANYLGEYYSPQIKEMPTGNWYFDPGKQVLVYLLNNGKTLREGEPNVLKFKVKLLGLPSPAAKPPESLSAVEGVVLDRIDDPPSAK
ncbi:MAG: type II secretion system protein [Pseudomonadota bacterium]